MFPLSLVRYQLQPGPRTNRPYAGRKHCLVLEKVVNVSNAVITALRALTNILFSSCMAYSYIIESVCFINRISVIMASNMTTTGHTLQKIVRKYLSFSPEILRKKFLILENMKNKIK